MAHRFEIGVGLLTRAHAVQKILRIADIVVAGFVFFHGLAFGIARLLSEQYGVDKARIEAVGRGWEEPLGTDSDQNRRVEVQWFTLE